MPVKEIAVSLDGKLTVEYDNDTTKVVDITNSITYDANGAIPPGAGLDAVREAVGGIPEILARYASSRFNGAYSNTQITAVEGSPASGQLGYSFANESTISNYTALNFNSAYPSTTYPVTTGDIRPFRARGGMGDRNGGNAAHVYTHFRRDQTTRERGTSRLVVGVASSRFVFTCVAGRVLRLIIDDGTGPRMVSDITVGGTGNQDVTLNFDQLGGNVSRTISVVLGANDTTSLRAAKWPNSATLWRVDDNEPQILAVTDSLGSTVHSSAQSIGSFIDVMADRLGCEVYPLSEGSTGYTTRGDSPTTKSTIAERFEIATLMRDGGVLKPSAIALIAGVNDPDDATLNVGVTDAITDAKAAFPGVPIVVFGPWAPNDTTAQATAKLKEDRISAACAAFDGVEFVPTMRAVPQYISGTGNSSSAANNGNADVIFSSGDGTHWNAAGHKILGARIADDFAQALRKFNGLT